MRDILYFCIACGFKRYSCVLSPDPNSCTNVQTCPASLDRCATLDLNGKMFFHINLVLAKNELFK